MLNLPRAVARQGLPFQHALNPGPALAEAQASGPNEAEILRITSEAAAEMAKIKARMGWR
jgi:hypothetical protein